MPASLEYGKGDFGFVDNPMFFVVYADSSVPLTQNPNRVYVLELPVLMKTCAMLISPMRDSL